MNEEAGSAMGEVGMAVGLLKKIELDDSRIPDSTLADTKLAETGMTPIERKRSESPETELDEVKNF